MIYAVLQVTCLLSAIVIEDVGMNGRFPAAMILVLFVLSQLFYDAITLYHLYHHFSVAYLSERLINVSKISGAKMPLAILFARRASVINFLLRTIAGIWLLVGSSLKGYTSAAAYQGVRLFSCMEYMPFNSPNVFWMCLQAFQGYLMISFVGDLLSNQFRRFTLQSNIKFYIQVVARMMKGNGGGREQRVKKLLISQKNQLMVCNMSVIGLVFVVLALTIPILAFTVLEYVIYIIMFFQTLIVLLI